MPQRPEGPDQVAGGWEGRNLGITDLGSSTDFRAQYLASKNGVDISTIHCIGVQAGATPTGAMTTTPSTAA